MRTLSAMKILIAPSLSAVKGSDDYVWYSYKGTPRSLTNTKGSKTCRFTKGYVFGIRSSSDGKKIRLITQEHGPTIVFTIGEDLQEKLIKASKKTAGTKAKAEDTLSEDTSTAAWTEFSKEMHPKIKAYIEGLKDKGAQDVATLKAFKKQVAKVDKLINDCADGKLKGKAFSKTLLLIDSLVKNWPKLPKGKAFKDTKEGKIARAIHRSAVRMALKHLSNYNTPSGFDSIYLMGFSDAVDHLVIAAFMNQNDLKSADTYCGELDTASVDEIPGAYHSYRNKVFDEEWY